jgi:hypothetical protein
MGDDVVTQRKFGRKTTIQFGEDRLGFTLSDPTGRVEGSVFYELIDPDNTSTVTVNAGQRYYPPVILVAVLAVMGVSSLGAPFAVIGCLPVLIVICVWVLRFSRLISVTFTMLSVSKSGAVNRIRIIKDKQHDRILERIKAARIARIRRLHLAVNPAANPAEEAKKFKWLLDRGIIDEAEYRTAMGQLAPDSERQEPGWDAPDGTTTMN